MKKIIMLAISSILILTSSCAGQRTVSERYLDGDDDYYEYDDEYSAPVQSQSKARASSYDSNETFAPTTVSKKQSQKENEQSNQYAGDEYVDEERVRTVDEEKVTKIIVNKSKEYGKYNIKTQGRKDGGQRMKQVRQRDNNK